MGFSNSNSVLLLNPACPPYVQHAARALHEAGLLSAFATTFAYNPESALGRLFRTGLGLLTADADKQLRRRQITEIPANKIITHSLPEILRTAATKSPLSAITADLIWERAELWFDRTVARRDLNGEQIVYGYEHAALETFRLQKARGGFCLYDLPICHHKLAAEILEPEFAAHPEVESAYDIHLRARAPRRNARKDEELALADHVVVASSFTKRSLEHIGVAPEKISVVPYGAPPVVRRRRDQRSKQFVFLSAGTQSIRKGVHYTLEAWKKIGGGNSNAELWLVGAMQLPSALLRNLPGRVVVKSSVPRSELNEIYDRASVLVFPSLVEGFGQVITEAMSRGLPVITTTNTAGAELISDRQNGFLIPVRDCEPLASTMQWCLDHRSDLDEIGERATVTAASSQWIGYRSRLAHIVSNFVAK